MLKPNLFRTSWRKLPQRCLHDVAQSSRAKADPKAVRKIRNIGIVAHIDAGKTTTTERMLYYSGLIKSMGEVHDGNTVTDYMEQERQRGITIISAAVSFDWKGFRFNLIDTPGHIDFTMEVEQALKVQDGAVIILDGSTGVEAQTLTVCRQADVYDVPRIIYVNKMDKKDADFHMCLRSIESKLNVQTLPTQLPLMVNDALGGIIDVVCLEKVTFDQSKRGATVIRSKLTEGTDERLWELASEKRSALTDKLSELDDELADIIIQRESLEDIPEQTLVESLQRVTVDRKGVPVLLGSSYKNVGVQTLMDGVILYLPSPHSSKFAKEYRYFGNELSARVFKIVHDKQRGALTFLRIYSGTLKRGMKIYDNHKSKVETVDRIYSVFADDYEEIPEVSKGNIAAVTGLKHTGPGDLITNDNSTVSRVKSVMLEKGDINEDDVAALFDSNKRNIEPVFFRSIEAPSLSMQNAMNTALQELLREDPSLVVTEDADTGQVIIGGMGELHLEIVYERIRRQYKIDVYMGKLQIAYKETIQNEVADTHVLERVIGDAKHEVTVTMSVRPSNEPDNELSFARMDNTFYHNPKLKEAIKTGVNAALTYGPKLCCPVRNVHVRVQKLEMMRGTSMSMLSSAASTCVRRLLKEAGAVLMEPYMLLEVVTLKEDTSSVIADLGRKRGEIRNISERGNTQVIEAYVPASELLGYSTVIRKITSGTGTFVTEFSHYKMMDPVREDEVIKKAAGLSA